MSSPPTITALQDLTVIDILAHLISRNDVAHTMQVLSAVQEVMTSSAVQGTKAEAMAADVASTVASLIENNQFNTESIVLVSAAKHGYVQIVNAVLTGKGTVLPATSIAKALEEAQKNRHIAIAELLTHHVVSVHSKHPLTSDMSADVSTEDTRPIANKGGTPSDELVESVGADHSATAVVAKQTYTKSIVEACEEGDTEAVKLLLLNPHVDPSVDENRCVRMASRNGHNQIIKLLLSDSHVDATARNNYAIRMAIEHGHTEIVKSLLLDPRVDPNARFEDDIAPLARACDEGYVDIVKLLLADPRVNPANDAHEAIRLASASGHVKIAKMLLLDSRVNPGAEDNEAIKMACLYGHIQVVKLLLFDSRVNPAGADNLAFLFACGEGHTEIVKLLLSDARANPAEGGNVSICEASKKGHPEIMSVMLQDPRVNLTSKQSRECVCVAIEHGFVDVVAILLARFPQPDGSISELIRMCVEHGRYEILKIILHACTQQSRYVLLQLVHESLELACNAGRHQFVLAFLTESTDSMIIEVAEEEFKLAGPLVAQLACMHVDVLRVVLIKCKLVDADYMYKCMMNIACQEGSVDVVRELLDHHQDKVGDWDVNYFNDGALRGNMPVLRLLNLSRYGGVKKLAETPPLARICTRKVLEEMHAQSSFVMMCCIKKNAKRRTMGKLQDVLHDIITGDLLRFVMK